MHRLRPAPLKAALWLAATLTTIALPLAVPTLGHAEGIEGNADYNLEECSGHITSGTGENPEGEESSLHAIQYSFSCNGPITGYQIQSQLPIFNPSSSPLATNGTGEALGDAFSCSSELPGYAVNCVGTQGTAAPYQALTGVFSIESKLCQEPREDALLTVTYAYLEKGVITQAIAGPFDLDQPQVCKNTKKQKNRLEAEPVQEAEAAKKAAEKTAKKAAKSEKKKVKTHGAKGKKSSR